jgi:ABC-type nickel/cobalt efflux system permease component RcnA
MAKYDQFFINVMMVEELGLQVPDEDDDSIKEGKRDDRPNHRHRHDHHHRHQQQQQQQQHHTIVLCRLPSLRRVWTHSSISSTASTGALSEHGAEPSSDPIAPRCWLTRVALGTVSCVCVCAAGVIMFLSFSGFGAMPLLG